MASLFLGVVALNVPWLRVSSPSFSGDRIYAQAARQPKTSRKKHQQKIGKGRRAKIEVPQAPRIQSHVAMLVVVAKGESAR